MAGSSPSHRVERVSSLLRDTLAELIALEVKDPRVRSVTVTDVEVSGDLGEAKVFIALPEKGRAEALRALQSAAGFLRREVGRRIQMRTVPNLKFLVDTSVDYGARIDRALRSIGLSGAGPMPGEVPPEGALEAPTDDGEREGEPGGDTP